MVLNRTFLFIFLFFALGELALDLQLIPLAELRYITKPALMLSLMGLVLQNLERKDAAPLLVTLFFALGGDVFLLFKGAVYFPIGLGSFLIMQLLYIRLFLKPLIWRKFHFLSDFPFLLLVLGYVVFFLSLLWNGLSPDLQIPVVLYALALGGMAYFAFLRKLYVQGPQFVYVMLGALFFVLSDSLLAYNKFVASFPQNSFWVMSTYILAQLLLTLGLVNFVRGKR